MIIFYIFCVCSKKLEYEKYIEFANDKFEEGGKRFDPAVLENLYGRFDGVTSYIHRILNILYSRTGDGQACSVDMVDPAIDFVVRLSSDTYECKEEILFLIRETFPIFAKQ